MSSLWCPFLSKSVLRARPPRSMPSKSSFPEVRPNSADLRHEFYALNRLIDEDEMYKRSSQAIVNWTQIIDFNHRPTIPFKVQRKDTLADRLFN
jgi:hypothetical protein